MQTWNVLQAAEILDVGKVVPASSVNAIGAAFNPSLIAPEYLPLDEGHPTRVQDPSSLSAGDWSYTSLRDAARAMRLALEAEWQGHEVFFVNAAGTCLPIATAEAIRLYYPTVAVREELAGFTSAISTKKARQYFD